VDAAADWKDRSPMVERIVRGTIRQKTKQSEVAGEYVRWKRTATKMSGTLALNHGGTGT